MTSTVQRQVLINARALIADSAHWTTGVLASTTNGQPVAWDDPSATRWCAQGAIYRAAYDLLGNQKEAIRIGDEVASVMCPRRWLRRGLPAINDSQGHAAVLAEFDKALAAA